MNPREIAFRKIALRCKTDLYLLCKEVLGYDKMEPHAHQELCDYTTSILPTVPDGLYDKLKTDHPDFDPRKNLLLLLMPRGSFKSSVVTIGFTLQLILNEPNVRILIDSETFSKSKAFLREITDNLMNNNVYREIFHSIHGVYPYTKKSEMKLWTDSELILPCRTTPKKEPTISCAGIDVTKNGMHYDLIICDDLHSEKNVTSQPIIQGVIDHYKLAFSLLEPGKPLIIIGTRWHELDLYGHIIEFESEDFNILKKSAYNEDGSLFFPEVLNEKELNKIRKRQGTSIFCNPGEAPILMSDWSTKRIDAIKVGDEIIGYENGCGQRNKGCTRNKLVKTKVSAISSHVAMTQKVYLESGRVIRCTPSHEWYTGHKDKTHKLYLPVVIGRKMMQVIDTDDRLYLEEIQDWGWLGGMIDGEGACKYGSISIHQYPQSNSEVFQKIDEVLEKLRLPYKKYERSFVINGGRQSKFDILRYAKPAKSQQIIDTLWKKNTGMVTSKDRVLKIEPYKEETVYGLETKTGNYVVWGFASKNSKQYLNETVSDENAEFKLSQMVYKKWEEVKNLPMNWYLCVDPSYTDPRTAGTRSDFAAFVLVGMDYMRNLYIRYIIRNKMTYSEIINKIFEIHTTKEFADVRKSLRIILEVIGTKSLSYELSNEQKRRHTWLPITEIKNYGKDKEERIRGLKPFFEFGHIFLVRECPQIEELVQELVYFPVGKHDDIIDALANVLEFASPPNTRTLLSEEERRQKKRTAYKPSSTITGY